MEAPLISVIVPGYQIGPWLGRCLDSLLAQTCADLEILVVDDGSTDETAQVGRDYAAAHPQIRFFTQANAGVTAARLRGVELARGQWLGFVDGDDVVEPRMYARLLENARTYQADISHCGQQVVFPDGRVTKVCDSGELRLQDRKQGLEDLLDGGTIESGLCTKLYRRELFQGLGEFMDLSVKNNEDFLMNYYLFSRAERAVFEGVCPYHYLLRAGSASYRPLSRYLVFDPIRVRQYLLETCEPEMQDAVRRCLMRNCLFGYARITMERGRQWKDPGQEVRQILAQQKPYFGLLSRRNQILANLITTAPWMFRAAYRAYAAVFLRQEQH